VSFSAAATARQPSPLPSSDTTRKGKGVVPSVVKMSCPCWRTTRAELEPREKAYRIVVRAKGFQSKKRWVRADKNRTLRFQLEPTKIDLDL